MDNMKEIAKKLAGKLTKIALIKRWEEGEKALRSLDTPDQSKERKQREEEAHDVRRAEEDREYNKRARLRIQDADRAAAQTKQEAVNVFFTIAFTILGIVLVIFLISWICSLFKK
ncbi:MAG: hypothetical protein AB9903_26545 [Vulcanimicrobiota bacterium]